MEFKELNIKWGFICARSALSSVSETLALNSACRFLQYIPKPSKMPEIKTTPPSIEPFLINLWRSTSACAKARSEERRVGKESRSRWTTQDERRTNTDRE